MTRTKVYVSEHEEQSIGREVHVDGWGTAFFTVQAICGGNAHLSRRYSKKVKYKVAVSLCYFTRTSERNLVNDPALVGRQQDASLDAELIDL